MSKNSVNLVLSRKQAILLLWISENVLSFLESFEKLDFNLNVQELKDFVDYLNFNLKS